MAKMLKNYKRRELNSVVVEDFETGKVFKIVDMDEIERAINKYSENEITKIYNPTQKQKDELFSVMSMKEEDGVIKTKLEGIDMFTRVIPMITDIDIDLTKEEDIDLIQEIIKDPGEVFEHVAVVINEILCTMNLMWIENTKIIGKLPNEVLDTLTQVG